MERSILETLRFFKMPLKAYEIHKWLSKKATLRQIENTLLKMYRNSRVLYKSGYYSLKKVSEAQKNLNQDEGNLRLDDRFRINRLKSDPKIRLISFDGRNLYIINGAKSLSVKPHNRDQAYQLLKMKILYQKDKTYFKLLDENSWIFRFFPNWTTGVYN